MKKILLSLLFFSSICFSQTFTQTQTCSLSATACVVTIQQPTAPLRSYRVLSISVSSTVALSINVERSTNLATTTAGTPACEDCPVVGTAADALSFTSSNASAGTVLATYQIAAGAAYTINFQPVFLQAGTVPTVGRQSFTARTSSATGTVSLVINWQESTP